MVLIHYTKKTHCICAKKISLDYLIASRLVSPCLFVAALICTRSETPRRSSAIPGASLSSFLGITAFVGRLG